MNLILQKNIKLKKIIYEPFFDVQDTIINQIDEFEFDKSKVNIVY